MSAAILIAWIAAGGPPTQQSVVRCRPPASAPADTGAVVPWSQAEAVPNGRRIRLIGYLIQEPTPFSRCPPGATCEAPLPPFSLVGDGPPGDSRGSYLWIDSQPCQPRVGERAAFVGQWRLAHKPGADRVFEAVEVTLLPLVHR